MVSYITILIAFDIVNMHASIDNDRSIAAVRNALKTKENKTRQTDFIIEDIETCLNCNNSRFGSKNLLQLNDVATSARNSCSYAHLDVFNLDKRITSEKKYPPKNETG